MEITPLDLGPRPPLKTAWRTTTNLSAAVLSGSSLYGITPGGSVVAFQAETGAVKWQTPEEYLPSRISAEGTSVFVFKTDAGLEKLTDLGATYAAQTLLAMTPADLGAPSSQCVPLGANLHFINGSRFLAVDTSAGGVAYQTTLPDEGPYSLYAVDADLLVVSGAGKPTRYLVGSASYSVVWSAGSGAASEMTERACVVTGDRLVVAQPGGVAAYNKNNGSRQWTRPDTGNLAFAARGGLLFCAGDQAALWSLNLADGSLRWDREYLTFVSSTSRVGLAMSDQHLWVGALLDDGGEPSALWAVSQADGSFAWQACGVTVSYGNGLPIMTESRLYTYGSTDPLTAMENLPSAPAVTTDNIRHTPNPLRGPWAGFNPLEAFIQLSVPASVSFIAWHERDPRNNPIGPISYQPGKHYINWDGRFPRGWTDVNQFGRLAFEIQETNTGLTYSQVLLIPVNTLPDIHFHWAKRNIETMIFHKYIGGYPDLTFRPDNLVTRGESSTIIAQTLGLERPSSGFRTKFTDIATHWARNYIMALEERGVVGGFLEPDGTYTFRADLNMTRAQEARILMRAYSIAPAPDGFNSRFTDIAGHWAEGDIKALEVKGYVNGFREADGSFTYRPEQNLTRAELCTVVVRIRNLTR